MHCRRCQPRAGFSLVELTIAIVIIATLGAIAMPRYSRALTNYRVKAAAQRITLDLMQAQSLARTTSTSQTITFNLAGSRYQIANLRDLDSGSTTYNVLLSGEPYKASITAVNLGVGSQVIFDGYGAADRGGTITIQSGDATKTITIDAVTGRTTVQ